MAHKTYNTLWREVMQTLIHLLEMETTPSLSSVPSTTNTTTNTNNTTNTTSSSRPSTANKTSSNNPNSNSSISSNSTTRTWKSGQEGYAHFGHLYLGYISVARGLEDCYDQVSHPQKRKAVLAALLPVLGRLVEIHDCLVNFAGDEFIPMDSVLQSMGVTPSALTLPVPRFFKEERARELEERDKLLTALLAQYTVKHEFEGRPGHNMEQIDNLNANMSLEEAVRIIQVNERGRQGRRKCLEARAARSRDRVLIAPPVMEPDAAAVLIQKTFRGHLTRKKTKAAREDELVFLGMKASNRKKDVDLVEKAEATRARRKLIQNQNELEYQQAIQQMRQTILDQEGPDIKEQMQDDVRKYFLAHKEQLGRFPVFPGEDEGGSAKMLNPLMKVPASPKKAAAKPPPPKASSKTTAKGAKLAAGSKAAPSKPLAKTPSSSATKPVPPTAKSGISRPVAKGTKKEAATSSSNLFAPIIPPSNFLPDIHAAAQEYLSVWAERDEEANFAQKHDIDLVRETLRPQIESEIRKQVDELLRQELENLKTAVEKKKTKKKGKKKKGDAKSTEPKKEKKEKKEKKKKGRKGPKDPTADRSIQSLYAELVSMNIVINCPTNNAKLSDFVAVYSPNSPPDVPSSPSEQTRPPAHVPPAHASLFGVLQAIMNICILPLGSPQSVSGSLPPPLAPRSLLLVAPQCYGKSMLCNIIANETGSVLLNLDPINLVNANTSRSVSLVVHMAFKVAKAMSPSVIYIDNVEQIFVKPKKKAKTDKNKTEADGAPGEEPKPLGVAEIATLMRKELVSQINALQPGDRVLVIGMTRQPWVGTMGGAGMGFERQLLIPAPDPASLTSLWSKLVQDNTRDLAPGENLILANLSQSLPPGLVQRVVEAAIKGNGDKRPLQSQDFVAHMAKIATVQELKNERAQLAAWWHSSKRGPPRLLPLATDDKDPLSEAPKRPLAAKSKTSKPAAKLAAKK